MKKAKAKVKVKRARRRRTEWCSNCGGSDFVSAVDNHGQAYMGCSRCVIVLPEELAKELRERVRGKLDREAVGGFSEVAQSTRAHLAKRSGQ